MHSSLARPLPERKGTSATRFGVCFRDLSIHGHSESTYFQHTFISAFFVLPTLLRNILFTRSRKKVQILQSLDGVVQGGEMLLVLGRPGSGCSTLLKTVAGDVHGVTVEDESVLNYGGISFAEAGQNFKGKRIYVAEHDVHFPELKVKETLGFAMSMCPAGPKPTGNYSSTPGEEDRDICAVFGLDSAMHTLIGNDMIGGASGGEKRRTSMAEAFISRSDIQCWDNSTRGLDSLTALNLVSLLRDSARSSRFCILMSLYQASEAMYQGFDKVTVLYEGRQIYFGPASHAAEYFHDLGFERPAQATTADFLTSVTTTSERRARQGYESRVPRSPDDFADAWKRSQQREQLLQSIEDFNQNNPVRQVPQRRNKYSHNNQEHLETTGYRVSLYRQIRACVHRAYLRYINNPVPIISGIIGNAIMAVVMGSAFFSLSDTTSGFQPRSILLFYSVMINSCLPAFEVNTMWAQRPIVEKHNQYAYYFPAAEGIASMISDLPNKIITSLLFNLSVYFMAGLRNTASAFFTFYLFSFTVLLTMSMLFRMVGSLSRTHEQAMTPVAIMIINLIIYTGFVVPVGYMKPWLGWIRYINPIAYAYESLAINEFSDRVFLCDSYIPVGPQYDSNDLTERTCLATGAMPGKRVVQGNDFLQLKYSYSTQHLWRNLGILFALMFFFCAIHLLAAQRILSARSKGEVLLFRRRPGYSHRSTRDEETSPNFREACPEYMSKLEANYNEVFTPKLESHRSILHWSDVKYEVPIGKEKRAILNGIDGWVEPGVITALMGATGAGKTSLLDVLAGCTSLGFVSGDIFVNGRSREADVQRKIGYVQQNDLHLPSASVREALQFSALLRQAKSIPASEKLEYVETVLAILDMQSYADAIVGRPGQGLNIEQRKRLTIAIELVAKPELLIFFDEPTSGLDSQTAWSICSLLQKLADNGQAILCTIHQPSAQIFQNFDRLLLLREGKQLYFGEIGEDSRTVIDYFEEKGLPPCAKNRNPAEWLMEITGATPGSQDLRSWAELWEGSTQRQIVRRKLLSMNKTEPQTNASLKKLKTESKVYAAPMSKQLHLVVCRIFQEYWRDPSYLWAKLTLCVGAGFFNGISFYMVSNDAQGITSTIFSIFLLLVIFSTISQQIIPRFINGRTLFEAREKHSKTYSWIVFVSANIIAEACWQSLTSIFVFVGWYYPTGLWRNGNSSFSLVNRGGLTFALIWLFMIFISTLSQAISAGIEHSETAVNVAQLLSGLCSLFCGVLVLPKDLPKFWTFLYHVSPFTYLIDGLVIAGLADSTLACSEKELARVSLPAQPNTTCGAYLSQHVKIAGGYVTNPEATSNCLYCPLSNANTILEGIQISPGDGWRDLGIFAVYIVVNVVATFFLYWLKYGRASSRMC